MYSVIRVEFRIGLAAGFNYRTLPFSPGADSAAKSKHKKSNLLFFIFCPVIFIFLVFDTNQGFICTDFHPFVYFELF